MPRAMRGRLPMTRMVQDKLPTIGQMIRMGLPKQQPIAPQLPPKPQQPMDPRDAGNMIYLLSALGGTVAQGADGTAAWSNGTVARPTADGYIITDGTVFSLDANGNGSAFTARPQDKTSIFVTR